MNRRLVNLLVEKLSGGRPSFSLHRIDPGGLFYPAGAPRPADPAPVTENAPAPARLPPATISFDWPTPSNHTGWMNFIAVNNDIVAVDHEGRTVLYDGDLRAVRNMPAMRNPTHNIISFTVGDGLFVLSRPAGQSRQEHHLQAVSLKSWPYQYWHPIQPLAFNRGPTYSAYNLSLEEADEPYEIGAYTVVGDSAFWVSTVGAGTYCLKAFETASKDVSGTWRKVGHWALPFRGRAEYVPEHGLWFGFSGKDEHLCAADLLQEPPVLPRRDFSLMQVWEVPPPLEPWTSTASHLLPLGSGRLCVARFFRRTEGDILSPSEYRQGKVHSIVVLAGVEIVKNSDTGGLEMIRHKSVHYGVKESIVEPV